MMRFFFWRKDKKAQRQPEGDVQQIDRKVPATRPKPEPHGPSTILDYLLALNPTDFEHAITRLLPLLGYNGAKRKGGAGDLGVDIVCFDRHGGLVVVQCKRYAPSKKVMSPDIQTFFGMMVKHAARQGIYVTTSTFTRGAFDLAADRDIRTIDGAGVATLFARHPGALGLGQQGVQLGGRTSYERPCRFCNRQIQMRLMPDGKWLPFDGAGRPHDCRSKR
jgi:restriction endonuclease Mrr